MADKKRDSDYTRESYILGAEAVNEFLKSPTKEIPPEVHVGLKAMGIHVKARATEANEDTNRLGMAKLIYTDPRIREEYCKATMPHMLAEKAKK